MTFTPNATQVHALLRLMLLGERPQLSKLRPSMSGAQRQALVDAGLLRILSAEEAHAAGLVAQPRGRSKFVVPEEDALWRWMNENFDRVAALRPHLAREIVAALLARLAGYKRRHGVPLAELLAGEGGGGGGAPLPAAVPLPAAMPGPAAPPPPPPPPPRIAPLGPEEVERRLLDALLALGGGRCHERVRLCALRAAAPEVPRGAVDAALRALQDRGALVLYRLDDPQEIAAADEEAALDIIGHKRHIAYLTGQGLR